MERDPHYPGCYYRGAMPTLAPVEGALLARIADALPAEARGGLSAAAFATLERALQKTTWAAGHRRRLAWLDRDVTLATAERVRFDGRLDGRSIRIAAIGSPWADPTMDAAAHAAGLIAALIDAEREDGADLVLLTAATDRTWTVPEGFEPIPTTDVGVRVVESTRYGAPMTLVRGGEDRDLAAIVAMGDVRARLSRFHLVRNVDVLKYALTRRRLLAGLAPPGQREMRFLIAEEGITAAAYVVLTATAGRWTIEECGDRDASGARVGALLQATIAREPVEQRPVIRGWLPPALAPPQLTLSPAPGAPAVLYARGLSAPVPRLTADEVLYWLNDVGG